MRQGLRAILRRGDDRLRHWLSVAVVIGQPVFTIFSALARMTRVGQPQQSVASSAFCVDHLLTSFPERFVMRMADLS